MKKIFFSLMFSLLATSVVIASDLPKFDPPPDEVVYRGVTEEQWETISRIGDPLNCRQRVYDLQNLDLDEFYEITAEQFNKNPNLLNAILAENNKILFREGTYKLNSGILLGSKILIGHPNERIIINAKKARTGIDISNSIISNIIIQNSMQLGVMMRSNNLVYRVVVGNTGLYYSGSDRGIGISQHYAGNHKNNCLVSVEAYNGYNYKSSYKGGAGGGAADGFDAKFSGTQNLTYIDAHAHHNSDHGFDFYCSGNVESMPVARLYYSSAIKSRNPYKFGGDAGGIKIGGEPNEPECDRNIEKQTPRIMYSTVSCYNPGRDITNSNNIKLIKLNDKDDPFRLKCGDFRYVKKIKERSFDIVIKPPKKGCDFQKLKVKKCSKKIYEPEYQMYTHYQDNECVSDLKKSLEEKGCEIN